MSTRDVVARVAGFAPVFYGRDRPRLPWLFALGEGGFDGWQDGVEQVADGGIVKMPRAHGSYDSPGSMDSRVIKFAGTARADHLERLEWMGAALTGLLADGGKARLTVEHAGRTLWTDVRLTGRTRFQTIADDAADYQIQFWAPDPRRYGALNTFTGNAGGALPVSHRGNIGAAPIAIVAGSGANRYRVYGPSGKFITVTRPLVAGHPHRIDCSTGRLYVDGVRVLGGVSEAFTWRIGPGAGSQMTLDPNGNATTSFRSEVLDTFS